jgi:hypothetical protein
MMNCKQATRAIEQANEHRLSWLKRLELRFHLLICKSCMLFHKQWEILERLLSDPSSSSQRLSEEDKSSILIKIEKEIHKS